MIDGWQYALLNAIRHTYIYAIVIKVREVKKRGKCKCITWGSIYLPPSPRIW